MTDIRLQPQYFAPPVSPPPGAALPPPYEAPHSNKIALYAAISATVMSGLGFLAYWFKPEVQENIIYVDKPVYVNNTVYVDKPFLVEKTIETIREVTRDVPTERIVYVDKVVEAQCPELVTTTKIIHEYVDPYNGL